MAANPVQADPVPRHASVTGLVLAGGQGGRMGGADKGLMPYRGQTLVEQALARLAPQVAVVVVSANRHLDRYAALAARHGGTVVSDATLDLAATPGRGSASHDGVYLGPLAGMLAGLSTLAETEGNPWLAVVPCDLPDLPPDHVRRLLQAATAAGRPAAVARVQERLQPTVCLLHRSLREDLQQTVREQRLAAGLWLESVGACAVDFPEAAAFRNLNTLEDLAA